MTDMEGGGAGAAQPASALMTEAQFRSLYERMARARRWGPDDRRGALNDLTADRILTAAGEVRIGRSVSLAAPIEADVTPDNPEPAVHVLRQAPAAGGRGVAFNLDRIDMNIHGDVDSHIDALSHVIFDGAEYNGVPADDNSGTGAFELSIATAAAGIVGRGVLLDVPRSRGVSWVEPGDHVTVDDVLAAERDQGVRLGRGDIALVRVGHRDRRREHGPWNAAQLRAGLHPEIVPLLAERGVAVLGSDGNGDTAPSIIEGVDFPVHVLAVNALGMMLLDYLEFETLVPLCEQLQRWSFLCVIAPLRLPAGTGSPINPIAVL